MIEMLQKKLRDYGPTNAVEEENATKEIIQEIALYALWRADFFDVALFQGGTSLRIVHALPRFSEDLDFLLRVPDADFQWSPYLSALVEIFGQFGMKRDWVISIEAIAEYVQRSEALGPQSFQQRPLPA